MSDLKVLLISHNHPEVRAGGAEQYAAELYDAMRASSKFEPILVARAGPPVSQTSRYHEGTLFTMLNEDPNQYLVYTDVADYDWLYGRSPRKATLTRFFQEFLTAHQPDVVHFQHTLFLGYDAIRVARNALPDVPIVYTLHEYLPICHNNGQMLRTMDGSLCAEASPRRCHECYPNVTPQTFFMRRKFIESHLSLVDRFIAPSITLLERYLEWGLPEKKIVHEPYGRPPVNWDEGALDERARNRLGFFGQLTPYKGIEILLEAMRLLGPDFDGHLWIHGANLDLQPHDYRDRVSALLDETRLTVTYVGAYAADEVGERMATVDWIVVPSLWWENSPLVIEEAFLHKRPVICSNVGGMAEKVSDGVDGFHFRRGDAHHLAEVIERATGTPGIWEKLRSQAPAVHDMDTHLGVLEQIYEDALAARTRAVPR